MTSITQNTTLDNFLDGNTGLFDWYLEYQQTPEGQQEIADGEAREAANKPSLEYGAQQQARYRKQHPTAANLRYRAEQQKQLIIDYQRNECFWCGETLDSTAQIDHIIPIVKGGTNQRANLCVCHRRCNSKKGAKLPGIRT